jgi:predicted nuclease of predicted toxin-antitoxin system
VRLLADTNIVANAVQQMRAGGHDVVYVGERDPDPGDQAVLAEAHSTKRVLLTKDHDVGTLIFRDRTPHAGVLLVDDLGAPLDEAALLTSLLTAWQTKLAAGAFVRGGKWGARIANDQTGL